LPSRRPRPRWSGRNLWSSFPFSSHRGRPLLSLPRIDGGRVYPPFIETQSQFWRTSLFLWTIFKIGRSLFPLAVTRSFGGPPLLIGRLLSSRTSWRSFCKQAHAAQRFFAFFPSRFLFPCGDTLPLFAEEYRVDAPFVWPLVREVRPSSPPLRYRGGYGFPFSLIARLFFSPRGNFFSSVPSCYRGGYGTSRAALPTGV